MKKEFNKIIHETVFVAEGARITGNVKIEKDASVWYNAVIRSDLENIEIRIGERSNIQDGTVIHVDYDKSTIIGSDVTIGHNCTIHGCIIEDGCLVGMGATILSGAHIKKGAIIGAGAVVKENSVVEENALAVGVPAKVVKELTETTYADNVKHAIEYVEFAKAHKNGLRC